MTNDKRKAVPARKFVGRAAIRHSAFVIRHFFPLLALAAPAIGQISLDSPNRAKDAAAVYVRDSGVASEKLNLAGRMEKAAQWDKSADIYQEIVEKFADRVVPTHTDSAGQPTQYTSVAMVVQEKVAKWPEAGLNAYRKRFEDVAHDQLVAAGDDTAALQRVMSLYFPTDAGKAAGMKLLAGSFERGQFAMASWIGRRLLTLHPTLTEARPAVLFETALAEHLGGNDAAAQEHLADLQKNFPNALGTVRGVETKLADSLANELAGQPAIAQAFRQGDWPMAFGAPDADAVPADVSNGGARLFSIELASPVVRGATNRANYKSAMAASATDRNIGAMTGILPAVENGELFFQDNARVYAVSLATGMPLPGWLATYPGDKHGQFITEATPTPRGQQMAVSVTGDSVFAILGQIDFSGPMAYLAQPTPPQVVSLDRGTGKRNWATTPERLKLPESAAALRQGMFYGTPVVVGDSIYVMVRATRGGQFDECHVVSLKASDGSFQWSSYVASTSLGNRFAQFDDGSGFGAGATGQLSYADGRLYVLTNLGALACLDASDGKTLWLDIYPRSPDQIADRLPNRFLRQSAGVTKPFSIDPPIVHGNQVFVMPQDSASTLVYDAASGDLIATVPRALDPKFEPADMLLAVVGQKIVLGNRGTIFTLPWKGYDTNKSLVENGGMYRTFTASDGNPDDAIRGRPFVTGNYVLVPTGDKLYRMSLDQFKFVSLYPAQGKWDDQESPGNVIATPDNLIIAGPTRVTAYADLNVATAKLDEQLKSTPDDVEVYIRYAGLLFAAGRVNDGIAKVDAAIGKLGGLTNLASGPGRDHLFDLTLGFATKLQKVEGTSPKTVQALFERAWVAADAPEQQVRLRFALATLEHQNREWLAELSMYQQVLANPAWRRVPVNGPDGAYTAAAQAEAAVTQILKDNGQDLYAPYEAAAAKQLAALKNNGNPDPKDLLEIADEYPHSTQTLEALALAADRYEAEHDPRQAARTLRRLLHADLSNERKLVTLQALARNYLAVPQQIDTAIARLRQAKTIASDAKLERPLTMPDGKTVADQTIGQALELAQNYRDRALQAQLPTFGVSPTSGGQDSSKAAFKATEDLGTAVALVTQQNDVNRPDRVVTLGADNHVHAFDSATAKPVAGDYVATQPPIGCAYSGENLVIATPAAIAAIDASGKTAWEVPLSSLPAIEAVLTDAPPAASDENKDGVDVQIAPPRRRFPGLRNPRLRVNIGPNGVIMPVPAQIDVEGDVDADKGVEKISNFRLLSDRVLIGTTAGRLASIGLKDGKIDWQSRPLDRPLRHFLSNDDFLAVSYGDTDGSSTVCVLDAAGGQILSRDVYDVSQPNQQLANLALSPDGVLVTMTPNQLIGRDLYEPGTPSWKLKNNNLGAPDSPFIRSGGPEQLVITADRVLAVYFSNGTQQSVRAYDLRTLQPMKVHDDVHDRLGDATYSTKAPVERMNGGMNGMGDQMPVSIQAIGPVFYLVGSRSLAAYNLDRPDWQWESHVERGLTRDFVIGSDYAVQLNQVANVNPNAEKVTGVQMMVFSRAVVASGVESGNLEQRVMVRDPDNLLAGQWQVGNGAFYYVNGAHKLRVMKANP